MICIIFYIIYQYLYYQYSCQKQEFFLEIKSFHEHGTYISHGTYVSCLFADDSSYKTFCQTMISNELYYLVQYLYDILHICIISYWKQEFLLEIKSFHVNGTFISHGKYICPTCLNLLLCIISYTIYQYLHFLCLFKF